MKTQEKQQEKQYAEASDVLAPLLQKDFVPVNRDDLTRLLDRQVKRKRRATVRTKCACGSLDGCSSRDIEVDIDEDGRATYVSGGDEGHPEFYQARLDMDFFEEKK